MARTLAELPKGSRITDYISLGVLAKTIPIATVKSVLEATGKASQRQRDLPAHVVVYYVIALALYMQSSYREVLRCLLEGIQWLSNPTARQGGRQVGNLAGADEVGSEPVRQLHDAVVGPIAGGHQGAWYRGWRLVSLDGSTLDVADEQGNDGPSDGLRPDGATAPFRKCASSRWWRAAPTCCSAPAWRLWHGRNHFGQGVLPAGQGMLCLADRNFFGFELWRQARRHRGRIAVEDQKKLRLPCEQRLADGSYLSRMYPSKQDRSAQHQRSSGPGHRISAGRRCRSRTDLSLGHHHPGSRKGPGRRTGRAVSRTLGDRDRLGRTEDPPARRGNVLRSKTPDLVRQEFYGLMMAHFAIRGLMHEAALKADVDPDRLSFIHAVRVVRRKLPSFVAIPPSAEGSLS